MSDASSLFASHNSCPQWQSTGAQRKMLPSILEHWKGGERRRWSLWQERELLSPFRKQRRRAHRPLGGRDHGQSKCVAAPSKARESRADGTTTLRGQGSRALSPEGYCPLDLP